MFLRTMREKQDVKGNSKTKHKKHLVMVKYNTHTHTHIIQQILFWALNSIKESVSLIEMLQ